MTPCSRRWVVICFAVMLCVAVAQATVVPLSGIVMVKAGAGINLTLRTGGTMWAWGGNSVGQLGDGTTTPSLNPRPVVCGAAGDPGHCSADGHLKGVQSISAGGGIAMALLDSGAVLAWGNQSQFNNSSAAITPVYVPCGAADAAVRRRRVRSRVAPFCKAFRKSLAPARAARGMP